MQKLKGTIPPCCKHTRIHKTDSMKGKRRFDIGNLEQAAAISLRRFLLSSDQSLLNRQLHKNSKRSLMSTTKDKRGSQITRPGPRRPRAGRPGGGRLAAVAEYIPAGDGTADIGVLVDDALHGTGLGTLLIEHLALAAAAEGVTRFIADVLTENKAMLDVLSDVGLPTETTRSGPDTRVIVALTAGSRLAGTIAARDHEAERAPRCGGVAGPARRGRRRRPAAIPTPSGTKCCAT